LTDRYSQRICSCGPAIQRIAPGLTLNHPGAEHESEYRHRRKTARQLGHDPQHAAQFVLYVKAPRFHWNVAGSDFGELHKFFESQYEALDEIVDDVAERARALDAISAGSLQEFLKLTRLKEQAGKNPNASGMLAALLADHESVIRSLRKDLETADRLGDAGTNDFLTGLMEQHEEVAWMLRSYLR
jgi:starvation-inducible DNA-binding protein